MKNKPSISRTEGHHVLSGAMVRFMAEPLSYEPFPEPGEPVFANHPAFEYEPALRASLTGASLAMLLAGQNSEGDGLPTSHDLDWLHGEIPIPTDIVEGMRARRETWLEVEGLPADTPIGFLLLPNPPKSIRDRWWRSAKRNAEARTLRHSFAATARMEETERQEKLARAAAKTGLASLAAQSANALVKPVAADTPADKEHTRPPIRELTRPSL